jgi:signal-transduction protein with cAMP-binding, CBS, and nucleotidyltransferase domain
MPKVLSWLSRLRVSGRDLCYKVLASGLDASTPVRAVMTAEPQAVSPETRFGNVLHLMYEGGW